VDPDRAGSVDVTHHRDVVAVGASADGAIIVMDAELPASPPARV
jgi:hypothetical protein